LTKQEVEVEMFFRSASVVVFALFFIPSQCLAQAFFQSFGFARTATATGQTETLGSVHLALKLGTTLADTLVIDVSPLIITNASASDIRVTRAGNLLTGAVLLDAENGKVRIPVNAGANSGSLRVDGIRVALAGTNASSVTAHLSWSNHGNFFDGTDSVMVVDAVKSGLIVDPMTDTFRIYANNVVDATGTIVLHEGYSAAFTNSSEFGQDTPTRIRIRVSDYPAGLTMKFPSSVNSSDSAATLTTVEGTDVDLPRPDGSTVVTYNFSGASDSDTLVESFKIPFTVGTSGQVAILQPTIVLSLAPIGAALPTESLPATNVPRYAEDNLVALPGTSLIITKTLYWSGIDNTRNNVLSVFNPAMTTANLTLSAFDSSGQMITGANVTNPARQSLSANQASNRQLVEIFGDGATTIATVRVQSTGQEVVALGTSSSPGVSDSVALLDRGIFDFGLPSNGNPGRMTLFNPNAAAVSGTLSLRTEAGIVVASTNVTLESMASLSKSLAELFGTATGSQVAGSFPSPVIAFETFSSTTNLDSVEAQAPAGIGALYIPFFATGGGYETEISLINRSVDTVTLTATALDNQGSSIGTPKSFTLVPSQQMVTTVTQMFQLQSFTTGYVRIDVPRMAHALWTYYPAITGHARIRSGGATTVLPLSAYSQSDAYIPNSGVSSLEFQGIALVNPTAAGVTTTLQALSADGTVLASASVNLGAGQVSSRLISEYFNVDIPEGAVVRVTSSDAIMITSITGSLSGDSLRSTSGLK
jgi:hypothetical protein